MPFTKAGRARLGILPFEAAIGFIVIVSGFAGLFHFGIIDPLAVVLPSWQTTATNVVYLLSGVGIIAGLSRGKAAIEGASLLLLAGSLLVRELVYLKYLGFDSRALVSGVFDLAILWAAVVRYRTLQKRDTIVRLHG